MVQSGLSQRALSRRLSSLGWHRVVSWVCEALKGRHRVPPSKLPVLAQSLGTTVLELTGCVAARDIPYTPLFRLPFGELTKENVLAAAGHGCRITLLVSVPLLVSALRVAAVVPGISVVQFDRLPPDMWIAVPVAYDPNEHMCALDCSDKKDVVPF